MSDKPEQWTIIDDPYLEPKMVDPEKAKAWYTELIKDRLDRHIIGVNPTESPSKTGTFIIGDLFYPLPEMTAGPKPNEPMVPLEQIVAEYAEAVGKATREDPAHIVKVIKAAQASYLNPPQHKESVKSNTKGSPKRKQQSRQDKQAGRVARKRERKARKAGR